MGKLEEKNRKHLRHKDLRNIILQTIAIAGVIGTALVAPGVIGALDKLGFLPRGRQREYITSSASKLVKRGLLFYDGKTYKLTSKGESILRRWQLTNFQSDKPKRWDKKWRVLIFDIPENKKRVRDSLILLFRQAGIRRLQNSVWVYPYDCENIITLLKTDFGVGKDLLYLIVDELENDKHLREEFGLVQNRY